MVGFKKFWFLLISLSLLASCVPDAKKDSECGEGQEINATLRTCVSSSSLASNNRPTGTNQTTLAVSEDGTINFDVNAGSDLDNDTLHYIVVGNPVYGTITNCMNKSGSNGTSDRSCTYEPDPDFNGTDYFEYKINDGLQDSADHVVVTIPVTAAIDEPIVTSQGGLLQTRTLFEDTSFVYTFIYTDPENNIVNGCTIDSVTNFDGPAPACTCSAGICTATFTPSANLNSATTPPSTFGFVYTLTDTTGAQTSGTETFSILPVDDIPEISTNAACDAALLPFNQNESLSVHCPTLAVADNDDADNGDSLTWSKSYTSCSWATGPNITEMTDTSAQLTGVPDDDDVGTCSITYKVEDEQGNYDTKTLSITVSNLAPELELAALNALATINEDGGSQLIATINSDSTCVAVAGTVCLRNDRIINGTLSYSTDETVSTCLAHGTLTRLDDPDDDDIVEFYFTPEDDYEGTCNISFTFNDDYDGTSYDTEVGTVTVGDVNDDPAIMLETATDTYASLSIPNQTTNLNTAFLVDADTSTSTIEPIIIDEGGGDDEVNQTLVKISVLSSNTDLIPNDPDNIAAYQSDLNSATSVFDSYPPVDLHGVSFQAVSASSATSADDGDLDSLYLYLTPVEGESGTSAITLRLEDSDGGVTTQTFEVEVTDYSATHNDWSNIYAVGATFLASSDEAYAEPQVRLNWNAFTAHNDTISGYNIYRSTSATGPFLTPLNSTPISPASRSWADTTLTSANAASIYYYRVKAISSTNGKPIDTLPFADVNYSSIRIPIPHHNMALVHRRIANYEACTKMSSTPIPGENNKCEYVGPGDEYNGYFDIGDDYFVDRYEASCNYTEDDNDCAGGLGGGCIGDGAPGVIGADTNIYYDRVNGTCYYKEAISHTWKAVEDLTSAELTDFVTANQTTQGSTPTPIKTTFARKPPITYIQQFKAHNYCAETPDKSLTSRLVHVAAAAWSLSTANIATLETGAALSLSTSQCNSTNAAQLSITNSLISNLWDTWTLTSGGGTHMFVMAGSNVTRNCQSRYGIQDLVGNVEEWNLDRFHAYNSATLNPIGANMGGTIDEDYAAYTLDATYNPYSFGDDAVDSESVADIAKGSALSNLAFGTTSGSLDSIFSALGLPTANSTDDSLSTSDFDFYGDYFYDTDDVTGDGDTNIESNELYGVASGGNYSDGTTAGRYTMRLREVCHGDLDDDGDCNDGGSTVTAAGGSEINNSTGFRCMMPAP